MVRRSAGRSYSPSGLAELGHSWLLAESAPIRPGRRRALEGPLDECDAVTEWTGRYVDESEPELTVGLLMDSLELQGILEGDPPGRGPLDEALMADEEDGLLVDAPSQDSVDLLGQQAGGRKPQVAAQGQGAHGRAVEEHRRGLRPSRVHLAQPLQSNGLIDECEICPRSVLAPRGAQGDDVRTRLSNPERAVAPP